MSKGAQILAALKTRLEKITVANGYSRTVKLIRLNQSAMDLDVPAADCPIIEIAQDSSDVEHGASALVTVKTTVVLLVVDKADATDSEIEDLLADIRACIYADNPSGNGNTGITLGGTVTKIQWTGTVYDLGMIAANRRVAMGWEITSHQSTYRG